MSENVQKAVKELRQSCKDPLFIQTHHNAVAIFGHEHVSEKEIVVLAHCLRLPEFGPDEDSHGIKSVVFRSDNRPVGRMAECEPNAGSITINLMRTFEVSLERCQDAEPDTNIMAVYHRNMILNMLHEIHHINYLRSGIELTKEQLADAEESAEKWAIESLVAMSRIHDLEPDPAAANPFLAKQIHEMLLTFKDDFGQHQREMITNHTMLHIDDSRVARECHLNFGQYINVLFTESQDIDHARLLPPGEKDPVLRHVLSLDSIGPRQMVKASVELVKPEPTMDYSEVQQRVLETYGPTSTVIGGGMDDIDSIEEPEWTNDEAYIAYYDDPFNYEAEQTSYSAANRFVPPPEEPVLQNDTQEVMKYNDNGYTPKTASPIIVEVYKRIYNHIFAECRPQLNSDMAFAYPEGVIKPIMLNDEERKIVVACDCLDNQGRWCAGRKTTDGMVRGHITSRQKLPAYKLYLNVGGKESVRTLMPQSVNTRYADGNLKKTSLAARGGSCILWVREGNDDVKKVSGIDYLLKFQDGVMTDVRR